MTERLHFHFSLSCTGEGNGNPLQCSCLENPRDGGAWWAAVCGVAQSQTVLKRLSSSSSSSKSFNKSYLNRTSTLHILPPSYFIVSLSYIFGEMYRNRASQMAPVVKNPSANAGDIKDMGLIPESGRSPRGGHRNPLQAS